MELRRASIDDLDDIYKLICELEGEELPYGAFRAAYNENCGFSHIHYVVAEEGEQLIGFISVHIQSYLHHAGKVAEIQELVVRDEYRGKKIGTILIEYGMKIAKDADCVLFEVCCNQRREASHQFYLSQGMKKSHYKFTYKLKA